MIRLATLLLLFTVTINANCQKLSVIQKGQILATILQGKISHDVKWQSPGNSGQSGYLRFELFYPRSIVQDSQEMVYRLDMCQRLFLSFFSSRDLRGLHSYQVNFPMAAPGHRIDSYELEFDPNFHDMEESEFMRLERLTRAIPYFAWSNYLGITSKERDRVVVNLKDSDQMTPDSCREDYCNTIAFVVYYYVFRSHLDKPLQLIYRSPGETIHYDYPVGFDFKLVLQLFNDKS
jgi:hypothetical protein